MVMDHFDEMVSDPAIEEGIRGQIVAALANLEAAPIVVDVEWVSAIPRGSGGKAQLIRAEPVVSAAA
jgi:hypothetical protein